jgi:membrane-anchored protein YejM (alkaline phosphatase superfamily)
MEDRRQLVGSFIEGISASDQQPTLYFLHTLLPHQPWVLLPSGQRNSSLAPLPGALREVPLTDEWELAQNQQRHLLQVGFIDRLVGRVVARLKETGLYDRALVVITSDHGVAFMAGEPNRTLSLKNVAEIMRVPLFIKFPTGVQIASLFPHVNEHGQRVSDRRVRDTPRPRQVATADVPT